MPIKSFYVDTQRHVSRGVLVHLCLTARPTTRRSFFALSDRFFPLAPTASGQDRVPSRSAVSRP